MTSASARSSRAVAGDRTPAQWYCLLAGAALLLAGALGWIADSTFETGADVDGSNLVIFEVNGWHNLVHLASGAVLLAASARRTSARTIALLFGIVYGAVAVWGLIDGNAVLGLVPVNGPDHVLHIALAAVGIIAALASPQGEDLHTSTGAAPGLREGRFSADAGQDTTTGAGRDRGRPTR